MRKPDERHENVHSMHKFVGSSILVHRLKCPTPHVDPLFQESSDFIGGI
jgi:hypothetical protein